MTDSPPLDISAWRSQIGALGVWAPVDGLSATQAVELAQRLEELGYGTLWIPETVGRDPFATVAHLAASTTSLQFATGIANIHNRHPGAMKQAALTLADLTGNRFTLGMGVSHAPLVEGIRGLDYGKPVGVLRRYLEAMNASPFRARVDAVQSPRLIGALGPKMIELSGELADGVHPYWTTPEHTAMAREILGPDKLLCVEQKVVLSTDAAVARETARQALGIYITLPNYRNNWHRLGFSPETVDATEDGFVDALVAWGDADTIAQRIDAHRQAGADHVCIQVMQPGSALKIDDAALAALAGR